MGTWKFVLANSSTMANIGELQCTNKQLDVVLNRPGSCSFRMPMSHDLAEDIQEQATAIKAYRTNGDGSTTLIWSGPVWNLEEIVDEDVMTVNAVGWFEKLNHRFLRYEKAYTSGSQIAGNIALDLLNIANNQKDGPISPGFPDGNGTTRPTGIVVGSNSDTQVRVRTYPIWQNIGQAITEWSDIENGYDFEITPDTKTMNVYANTPGSTLNRDRTQAQFGFEWGPHNLLHFRRTKDSAHLVNSQFAVGKFGHALAQNTSSMGTYGLFESIQQLNEVTNTAVLQAFANGEVAIRSTPREIYSMLPHPHGEHHTHVPEPFVDYRLGDRVYVTVNHPPRVVISKQAVRVYGISLTVDDQGTERISNLQVSP